MAIAIRVISCDDDRGGPAVPFYGVGRQRKLGLRAGDDGPFLNHWRLMKRSGFARC